MQKFVTTVSMDKPSIDDLAHFGIPGMKWGHRRARGHAGPAQMLTPKRQLDANKRDLKTLDKGGHLSVGLTKNRQSRFDNRDRKAIEKSNERMNKRVMTPEQRHARTKKVLVAAGAVTVAAAMAYGGYKLHNKRINDVVKATKAMPIRQVHLDMDFRDTPLGKKVAQNAARNAAPNMTRQGTKDLAKEMKSFANNQADLRDQLRKLNNMRS